MVVYGALNSMIFRKPGQVTSAELSKFTEGGLINLLAQDCQAVLEVGSFMGFFAMAPFQVKVFIFCFLHFNKTPATSTVTQNEVVCLDLPSSTLFEPLHRLHPLSS